MFLIITFIAIMAVGIAKVCGRKVHFKNTLIGVLSAISLANWIFLLYLTLKDGHVQSSVVLIYGVVSSYILNTIFFCLYLRVMREDEYYNRWREARVKQETVLVVSALLTSF